MLGSMKNFALKNDDKPHRCPSEMCGGSFSRISSDLCHNHDIPYWIIYLLPFKCLECGVRTIPHIGIRLFFWRIKFRYNNWQYNRRHKK